LSRSGDEWYPDRPLWLRGGIAAAADLDFVFHAKMSLNREHLHSGQTVLI
jgi:hypothetical protein